ncbi:putative effector of murein hydrolase LrgA (UPF0299 family) [Paenibacillus brasilensis]|uniref:Effector of murein hydrolase LrgA (UPF0299 family) n=1 Tax=Paenibacillus brasilensis TaxID=128574 RepID=A0ABU0KTV4_9BACL|nr:putative effector of murein hydrolase LrgA (UPF0299 family) [Paenibacillus brasilensis]
MKDLRKVDYISIFIIIFVGFLVNIVDIPNQSILPIILKSVLTSFLVSLVLGSITNWLFRKK